MLYQPDLIIYLWLLPLVFLVVLPVCFATMRGVIGVARNMRSREDETVSETAVA